MIYEIVNGSKESERLKKEREKVSSSTNLLLNVLGHM